MREPKEFRVDLGGTELSVYEWAGTGDPVLLLHATGFHSRCWNEVVRRLPDRPIYAADLRFHGKSDEHGVADWGVMADDIRRLIEQLDLTGMVGAGHSLGGQVLARVAAMAPERFRHLVLIDPVIMPPERAAELRELTRGMKASDHPVSRRKNNWRDSEEMYKRFKDKAPFNTWQPAVLRDYCDYALRPADDGALRELACDPVNEANIYLSQEGREDIYAALEKIVTPVTLLRAPPGDASQPNHANSPTWPELASAIHDCREVYLPHLNHFIPMQDPELVADHIRAVL
jgi:pimeloyl-ACP methyl ester carboxylesterase